MPCVLYKMFYRNSHVCSTCIKALSPLCFVKDLPFSKPDQLAKKYRGLSLLQAVSNLLWSNICRYIQPCCTFGATDGLGSKIMYTIDQYR